MKSTTPLLTPPAKPSRSKGKRGRVPTAPEPVMPVPPGGEEAALSEIGTRSRPTAEKTDAAAAGLKTPPTEAATLKNTGVTPLSAQEEELLRAYSPTLARRYDIWKEEGDGATSPPMPRALAVGLRKWREQGCPDAPGASPLLHPDPRTAENAISSRNSISHHGGYAGNSQSLLPGIVVPRTPGETAPMSNYLARTSLFAPIRRGRRVMHDKQKLHSPEGIDVLYSGKQLDMADQDVYLTALRLAAGVKPGDKIVINRAAFLRMLGYKHNPGARDYKWLEEAFYRISTGRVLIEAKSIKANLPLIGALLFDERSGDYYFTIPMETYALWAKNLYGYIDLEKRHALERNIPLSKWLQSYAQSHAPGLHTISMELLHHWCGYGGRLRDFRDSLVVALEELTRVGILKSWEIQVRGAGRQKKNMITWVRERSHRGDTETLETPPLWRSSPAEPDDPSEI